MRATTKRDNGNGRTQKAGETTRTKKHNKTHKYNRDQNTTNGLHYKNTLDLIGKRCLCTNLCINYEYEYFMHISVIHCSPNPNL